MPLTFVALVPKIGGMEHTHVLHEPPTADRTIAYELCSILMRLDSARGDMAASEIANRDRLAGLLQGASMIVAEVALILTECEYQERRSGRSPEELEDERLAILDRATLGEDG